MHNWLSENNVARDGFSVKTTHIQTSDLYMLGGISVKKKQHPSLHNLYLSRVHDQISVSETTKNHVINFKWKIGYTL